MTDAQDDRAHLERRLEILEARLEQLEARLETVDESFVRHQDGNEGAFDRVDADLRTIERRIDEHQWQEHTR
jgi:predicted  nucleic acid-binding Zn-ribbon protein